MLCANRPRNRCLASSNRRSDSVNFRCAGSTRRAASGPCDHGLEHQTDVRPQPRLMRPCPAWRRESRRSLSIGEDHAAIWTSPNVRRKLAEAKSSSAFCYKTSVRRAARFGTTSASAKHHHIRPLAKVIQSTSVPGAHSLPTNGACIMSLGLIGLRPLTSRAESHSPRSKIPAFTRRR